MMKRCNVILIAILLFARSTEITMAMEFEDIAMEFKDNYYFDDEAIQTPQNESFLALNKLETQKVRTYAQVLHIINFKLKLEEIEDQETRKNTEDNTEPYLEGSRKDKIKLYQENQKTFSLEILKINTRKVSFSEDQSTINLVESFLEIENLRQIPQKNRNDKYQFKNIPIARPLANQEEMEEISLTEDQNTKNFIEKKHEQTKKAPLVEQEYWSSNITEMMSIIFCASGI